MVCSRLLVRYHQKYVECIVYGVKDPLAWCGTHCLLWGRADKVRTLQEEAGAEAGGSDRAWTGVSENPMCGVTSARPAWYV